MFFESDIGGFLLPPLQANKAITKDATIIMDRSNILSNVSEKIFRVRIWGKWEKGYDPNNVLI